MSRVEEIELAIDRLSAKDFRRLADWVRERDHGLWEQQMDSDSSEGRLDALFEAAKSQVRDGKVLDLPPRQ
jgi:hypothetical protein